jgi:hypothetical protein
LTDKNVVPPVVEEMVERLAAAREHLVAVVLYGARAHGDYAEDAEHIFLLIVLRDTSLEAVASVGPAIRWWRKKHKPMPRILSPELIREAADVFPIEFLDITAHHLVLWGEDPFGDLDVQPDHLRLQCERELREKMMRLQEGYIETGGKSRSIRRLMIESYLAFANIFRGCLHLIGDGVPVHTLDAVREFCRRAELDVGPFEDVDSLLRGDGVRNDVADTFNRYYDQLNHAVGAIDRFRDEVKGDPV